MNEDYDWLGLVLTFSDTASPVGGYAHSFGLEGMVQAGEVFDEATMRRFLKRDVRESLRSVELPIVARAYRAAMANNPEEVGGWDEWACAMRPTGELREAAAKVGRQQWKLFERRGRMRRERRRGDGLRVFKWPQWRG